MKLELEQTDIHMIAASVVDAIRPLLAPQQGKPDELILDVKALAGYLKVDPSWVYKQVQFKSIPHFHAGKYPRFKRKEIDAWIKEQSKPSTCAPYPKLKLR